MGHSATGGCRSPRDGPPWRPERQNARTGRGRLRSSMIFGWSGKRCHEAFLLRHLQGCADHRPLDTQNTQSALQREWPEYSKPMSRTELRARPYKKPRGSLGAWTAGQSWRARAGGKIERA